MPIAKSTATARRQSAATRRSTTSQRTAATRSRTRAQAQARRATQRPRTRAEQVQGYAERAVLVQLGAALETRDRVVSTVSEVVELSTSRPKAERQLKRFERRGSTARTRAQREVRKTRTRIKRDLRQRRARVTRTLRRNRERIERDLRSVQRDAESLRDNVAANADFVTSQVENAVQTGIAAGTTFAANASDRATSHA